MVTTRPPARRGTSSPAAQLARGFDSLTLDPSPRLRKKREQVQRSMTVQQAWKTVGSAIAEAIRLVIPRP